MYKTRFTKGLPTRSGLTVLCAVMMAIMAVIAPTRGVAAQMEAISQEGKPSAIGQTRALEGHRVFGDWIFDGQFSTQQFTGFNPDYHVATGDRINVQLWGGFDFQGAVVVDNQGNVFLPKVGPVKVRGVRNADVNEMITQSVQTVFKNNVGVYASLAEAEPVKIFVTGFVRKPGLYAGHSSDSILRFVDLAGGIDPARGSFIALDLLRGGEVIRTYNLYDFILKGQLPALQLFDGDTLLVKGVKAQVGVLGMVQNPFVFEFDEGPVSVVSILEMARPTSRATHIRVHRNNRRKEEVEYYSLARLEGIEVEAGDVIEATSDKLPGTIAVRVEGEHLSRQEYILPYGAKLADVLAQIEFSPNAERDAIQLFRRSVKARQKEMLLAQLQALESSVLTARSKTNEEAQLRQREAELVMQWVERARDIEPRGQVALGGATHVRDDILLESGDIIRIPRRSNLVMVHGDVLFPSAMAFEDKRTPQDYIDLAGGFVQARGDANVLILHRDGTFDKLDKRDLDSRRISINPGDEIFVLPRVQTKNFQLAKDVVGLLYQIAVSAGVILRL